MAIIALCTEMALVESMLAAVVEDARLILMHCFIHGNEDEQPDAGIERFGHCVGAGQCNGMVVDSICAGAPYRVVQS